MQRYIFLDLDDTLFQTLRKCPLGADDPNLVVRAYLPDGTPNSFATAKQQWLWDWLAQGFKIVPVTARDFYAFRRVSLPFQEEAVLNHGAVILDKRGGVDMVWQQKIMQTLPSYHDKLLAVWEEVCAYCQLNDGFKPRLVEDFGITWYGVIKHSDGTEATLTQLLDSIIKPHPYVLDGSLYWHLNGNNLAVLPIIITRKAPLPIYWTVIGNKAPELLAFGAGDSKTDVPFMALCDYALIPNNTQLLSSWLWGRQGHKSKSC